jgi:asparagine synthase (glutamine-hydrolysing)
MCGIIGIVRAGAATADDRASIRRLAQLTRHRGPDGEGFFDGSAVSLGMRRLAIVDLSGGAQPLFNEDRSIAVVANGEIYNHRELRERLQAKGIRFRSGSDCEVIPHLYEVYGEDFVLHLRGMFACAVWDTRRNRLLIARDRMGEKPLYLAERDGSIVFSSELRPLVESGLVERRLDPAALVDYFHYEFVPDPCTPIAGVRKLPAATMLVVDTDAWRVQERRYWDIHAAPPITGDPARVVREELERVIDLTTQADVPVGVCLSAGVDSSAVAALVQRRSKAGVQAVSVGFSGNARQDESRDAERFARSIGAIFHRVEIGEEDAAAAFEEVAFARDQPFSDLAGISLHVLMRRCRELGLLVMLSGQGGDELFFGYPLHRKAILANQRKAAGQQGLASMLRYVRPTKPPRSLQQGLNWLRSFGNMRTGYDEWRADRVSPASRLRFWDLNDGFREARRILPSLAGPLIADASRSESPFRHAERTNESLPIELEIMGRFIDVYLRENGLAQADRISMWHGVELRNPLVDYRLAEIAVGLCRGTDAIPTAPKAWLRAAVADLLPEWVLQKPKKGFSSPWRGWLNAIARVSGPKLARGALVRAGVLTPEAARALAGSIAPGSLGVPGPLAIPAITLECWARGLGFPTDE